MTFHDDQLLVQGAKLLLDIDTKRLLELCGSQSEERTQDMLEEIVLIIQRKSPKLLDGLTESNKYQIAHACSTKLYAFDEVVFNQGDVPDAYYTVIKGAVSIYALNSSSSSNESGQQGRNQYGTFITQLPSGESFGELSFNGSGEHSRRNAGVISDGIHGEVAKKITSPTTNDAAPPDVCVLLLIPEDCYMREMFARHSAKHQTKDKINLLKGSVLFQAYSMDQLVKLAYSMKKKWFERDSNIIQQGERMEHLWIIKSGLVRISHSVMPPNSIDAIQKGVRKEWNNDNGRTKQLKQPITVDIADLGAGDVIGLIECMEDSGVKKSQREVTALSATEMFFVPLSFFKPFLSQDACTMSLVEKVVERRQKWELLRTEYASKFPKMSMKLPHGAASMSNYAMDGCNVPAISPKASRREKIVCPSKKDLPDKTGSTSIQRRRQVEGLMRQNRMKTIDSLVVEAGLSFENGQG